jgi:glycosyl transferase family 25
MIQGYYINLDERVDRKSHFENNIKSRAFFSKLDRMSAIKNADGSIGCGLSHIKSLVLVKNIDASYIGIFEDDFCILNEQSCANFINAFTNIAESDEWDCIVLTPRGDTQQNNSSEHMKAHGFKRITNNQTATGYIIKKSFIDILQENLKDGVANMIKGGDKNTYATDQYWKRLQTHHRFYYYQDIFAGQLPGWSSIENRITDYNDRFLKQSLF